MDVLFCQAPVSKPVEKETKMEGSESPLPVPKGSYNFDFDNLDENVNPFQTRSKVIIFVTYSCCFEEKWANDCKLRSKE